jgi:hypothetical protein
MPFNPKTMRRIVGLIVILLAVAIGASARQANAQATTLLHVDFAQPIDGPNGGNTSSPLSWYSNGQGSVVTTGIADSQANDGYVAQLTLPVGAGTGPGNGPNIQSKQRFSFGTYTARVKAASCDQNTGAITGVFTYFNDGSDTNGNGQPDNSEIDFEWLCAEPQAFFMTMWTDYNPNTDWSSREYREVDLSTGTIRQTCYSNAFGSCQDISNSPTENQPTSIPAIPGYNSSTAYYTVGFTWTSTEVIWFIINPANGQKIVLWDYKGPASRITQVPAYFFINTWHSSAWTPTHCCSGATGAPTVPLHTNVDWMDISSNTSSATITPGGPTATNTATFVPPSATPTATATATGQPSATPTQTPLPTTPVAGGTLKVQLQSTSADNNVMSQFNVILNNAGSTAQSNLSVRIFFTLDNGNAVSNYVLDNYWDQSGKATISGPTYYSGATYYYTISWGATSLAPGSTWQIDVGLHLANWGATYSSANDWWRSGAYPSYPTGIVDTTHLPAYSNGTLIWGQQP